jgi:hypothetical protein
MLSTIAVVSPSSWRRRSPAWRHAQRVKPAEMPRTRKTEIGKARRSEFVPENPAPTANIFAVQAGMPFGVMRNAAPGSQPR